MHNVIIRYLVLASGIGLFALGGILAYFDKTGSAIATYGFGVLCLFFVFVPEFKRFKGFGVEAEVLERKIEEADRLLGQLRHLATPMTEMLSTIVARMGRWDSMVPRKDRYRLMTHIERQLESIGVPPNTVDSAKKEWHRFNILDLGRPLFHAAYKKMQDQIKSKDNEIILRPTISLDTPLGHTAPSIEGGVHGEIEGRARSVFLAQEDGRGAARVAG